MYGHSQLSIGLDARVVVPLLIVNQAGGRREGKLALAERRRVPGEGGWEMNAWLWEKAN